MKKQLLYFLLAIGAVAIVGLIRFTFPKIEPTHASSGNTVSPGSNTSQASPNPTPSSVGNQIHNLITRPSKIAAAANSLNVPTNYYAKIVDQANYQ